MSSPPSNPFLNDNVSSPNNDPFAPTATSTSSLVPESNTFVGTGAMDHGTTHFNTAAAAVGGGGGGGVSGGLNPMSPAAGINMNQMNNNNNNKMNSGGQNSSTPTFLSKLTSSCFSISTLQPYFDVDTKDVQHRIISAVKYANQPDYFREIVLYGSAPAPAPVHAPPSSTDGNDGSTTEENSSGGVAGGMEHAMRAAGLTSKGPDLYGPIWITLTTIFFLAVTSNTAKYLHTDSLTDFEYDVSHLARATVVLSIYTFCIPIVLYSMIRCLYAPSGSIFSISGGIPTPVTLLELISLYGYSLVPFILATIACLVPIVQLEWLFLLAATCCSVLLILRNVSGPLLRGGRGGNATPEEGIAMTGDGSTTSAEVNIDTKTKVGPMLMTIMVCHLVFCIVLKYTFYRHRYVGGGGGDSGGSSSGNNDADVATDDGTDGNNDSADADGDNDVEI